MVRLHSFERIAPRRQVELLTKAVSYYVIVWVVGNLEGRDVGKLGLVRIKRHSNGQRLCTKQGGRALANVNAVRALTGNQFAPWVNLASNDLQSAHWLHSLSILSSPSSSDSLDSSSSFKLSKSTWRKDPSDFCPFAFSGDQT
jgi:hypothetical protein